MCSFLWITFTMGRIETFGVNPFSRFWHPFEDDNGRVRLANISNRYLSMLLDTRSTLNKAESLNTLDTIGEQ